MLGFRRGFGRLVAAVSTVVLLASCGGGSTPAAVRPAASASTAAPASSAKGTVTVTIAVPPASATPAAARGPQYVSAAAQSIAFAVYAVIGGVIQGSPEATADQDLTASSPGCTSTTPTTCSISVSVPVGTVAFGATLYSGTAETGATLSQLDPTTATERTITEGAANVVVPLVLNGVPATLIASAPPTTFSAGQTASIPFTVVAEDAAGETILGPAAYETPLTLTTSDPSGFTFSPATITSPATTVTLQYNGGGTSGGLQTFTASAGAVTSNAVSLSVTPGALGITCSSGCSGLTNGSSPYALTVTQTASAGTITATTSGTPSATACNVDPSSFSISGGSTNVNLYPNPNGGTCTVTLTDTYAHTVTATTTFNAAALPTIVGNCSAANYPPDPNGGTLYPYTCGSAAVQYGAYYVQTLQSNTNPFSFQFAVYANTAKTAVEEYTSSGNRYITSLSVSNPNILINGQDGQTSLPISSLVP